MSGLIPRSEPVEQSGNFSTLTTNELLVNTFAFIQNLATNTFSILGGIVTPTVTGAPDLDLVGGTVTVNGSGLLTASSIDTLTNKTIDSATNTLQVNGTNINSLINQDVRTTASPSFVTETLTDQLLMNTSAFHPVVINQSSNTSGNDVLFQKIGVNTFGVGTNESTNESYTWTYAARDYKIGTSGSERLRILAGGIGNDNSIVNVLGLNGTTLVYKNNLIDTTSVQTLTNKTIDSASNTVQVNGVNINSLIDQDVRTTASPSWNTITCAQIAGASTIINGINFPAFYASYIANVNQDVRTTASPSFTGASWLVGVNTAMRQFPVKGSQAAAATTTILAVAVPLNTSISIFIELSAKCLDGTQTGYTSFIIDRKAVNNAGVISLSNGINNTKSDTALAGAYGGKVNIATAINGSNIDINLVTTLASGTCQYGGSVDVTYA
jgi:hypothetical protein